MTSRRSIAAPILAVLAVVLVTLGAYVGAYLGMGKYGLGYESPSGEEFIVRQFPHAWQAKTFWLAGQVEGWIRRTKIDVYSADIFRRGTPVDTPIRPIGDEELDWMVQQWADSEGVDIDDEWEAIKASSRVEDDKP